MPDRASLALSRRHRRLDQRRARQTRARAGGIGLGILLSLLLGVLILFGALYYADLTRDLPNVALLPVLLNPPDGLLLHPTQVYDRTGEHLLYTFDTPSSGSLPSPSGGEGTSQPSTFNVRRYIPLSPAAPQHLPDFLAKATVEMLDPGFWTDGGFTLSGLTDPDSHPTIAQKLVSDLLLYDEQSSLRRALRERILAAQVTAEYGRSQVVEWYLNSADYGNDAYGADAAAQLYFGVSATDLTPGESAVLAAASQAPGLNPLDAPDLAFERGRKAILLMQQFGVITADAARQALGEKLSVRGAQSADHPRLTAFLDILLHQLDTRFTAERIRRGGLVIATTLDYDLQQGASCATLSLGTASAPCPNLPISQLTNFPSASSLVLDPQSGQILAAAGETLRGEETASMPPHDPGTMLAPFVYLTAFTRGFGPGSLVWDIPPSDAESLPTANGQAPTAHGPVRMRIALANDYRYAVQRVAAEMGSEAIGRTEASFGLDPSSDTLLDLASAYGVFAANGVRYGLPGPTAVLRVEGLDHSTWLDLSNPQAQPVVSQPLAYLMNNALSDEAARWPSLGHPNDLEIGRPVGVKLGRSSDGVDSWGIGYTPSRVVAAWVGGSSNSVAQAAPANSEPLLSSLLQLATASLPADGWAPPPGVSSVDVCDPSGLLPTKDCPTTVTEVFLSGNEPVQSDTLFRTYTINRETGLLATVFTPPELVQDKVFMIVPPEAQAWAKRANIPVAPSAYDAIQAPPAEPNFHISAPSMFSNVTGKVQFRGTASGANFDHYRLLVGQGLNPQSWIVVAQSSTRIEDGVLGTWDTTGLSGLYAVELQVVRTDQQIDTAITQVTVK